MEMSKKTAEAKMFGDAVVSWLVGERAKDHSDKTRLYIGGVGEPVKE